MAIIFSLFSLSFAGINDLVFKKYGEKLRSTGVFLSIVGIIWSFFFIIIGSIKNTLFFNCQTFLIGLIAGITSAVSNMLYIEAIKKTGVGVGSVVYRLNLVFVALIAFLFLNEKLTVFKIVGLTIAILAIILIFRDNNEFKDKLKNKYLIILGIASILRACMGISYKVASIYNVSSESFLTLNGICWFVFGGLYSFKIEKQIEIDKIIFKYSFLSGLLVCGIVLFMKLAVNIGDASVVVTITQLSFLVTFPCSIIFLREKCTMNKILAVLLAGTCIVIFSL